MRTLALTVLLFTSLPALTLDACSVLNQIEIAATLRGPGVVVPFMAKTNQDKSSVCSFPPCVEDGGLAQCVCNVVDILP
jgi:hypothetical protein